MRQTTTLHVHRAFLYISSPSLHDYDVKIPNFAFKLEAGRLLFFSDVFEVVAVVVTIGVPNKNGCSY